jgi:hypothetical protein
MKRGSGWRQNWRELGESVRPRCVSLGTGCWLSMMEMCKKRIFKSRTLSTAYRSDYSGVKVSGKYYMPLHSLKSNSMRNLSALKEKRGNMRIKKCSTMPSQIIRLLFINHWPFSPPGSTRGRCTAPTTITPASNLTPLTRGRPTGPRFKKSTKPRGQVISLQEEISTSRPLTKVPRSLLLLSSTERSSKAITLRRNGVVLQETDKWMTTGVMHHTRRSLRYI